MTYKEDKETLVNPADLERVVGKVKEIIDERNKLLEFVCNMYVKSIPTRLQRKRVVHLLSELGYEYKMTTDGMQWVK